jgi:hypothetical protein
VLSPGSLDMESSIFISDHQIYCNFIKVKGQKLLIISRKGLVINDFLWVLFGSSAVFLGFFERI